MADLSNSICSNDIEPHCINYKIVKDNHNIENRVGEITENDYPKNTRPLENQVAGHQFTYGKLKIGMLKHKEGYLMKPIVRPVQGEKEIKFYEKVNQSSDPLLIKLKKFIPEYYGTSEVDIKGSDVKFILLNDLTNGFKEPCIMDVKIGKQTWEPGASLEKENSEKSKYADSKSVLSFCIPGFQVYNVNSKKYLKFGKDYGKQLNASGVYEALRLFFNHESGASRHILPAVVNQLKAVSDWFKSQKIFHMYSSSVLIAYDAAILRQLSVTRTPPTESHADDNIMYNQELEQKPWYCVSLIDFPHVVPANDVVDSNYITGIDSLINALENILSS